jgi:hypothetical protein
MLTFSFEDTFNGLSAGSTSGAGWTSDQQVHVANGINKMIMLLTCIPSTAATVFARVCLSTSGGARRAAKAAEDRPCWLGHRIPRANSTACKEIAATRHRLPALYQPLKTDGGVPCGFYRVTLTH